MSYFFDIPPKWSFVLFAYLGIDSVPFFFFYYEKTQVMWVLLEDRVPPMESEVIRNSVTLSFHVLWMDGDRQSKLRQPGILNLQSTSKMHVKKKAEVGGRQIIWGNDWQHCQSSLRKVIHWKLLVATEELKSGMVSLPHWFCLLFHLCSSLSSPWILLVFLGGSPAFLSIFWACFLLYDLFHM